MINNDKNDVLMKSGLSLIIFLLLSLSLVGTALAGVLPLPVNIAPGQTHADPLGRFTSHFTETRDRLSVDEAIAAYHRGAFIADKRAVPDFGIGARPTWLHLRVLNPAGRPLVQRLSIAIPWLDSVDVYFRHAGLTQARYHVGDREPFQHRPIDDRYFQFDHRFAPGTSDIFLRVATPDPMAVPLYLRTPAQEQDQARIEDFSYGFMYGFLFALLAYNAMLYVGLRHPRYLLYALYLGAFLLMNLSYTGHAFEWLWPEHSVWTQWSNPVLMVLYGASGLCFAMSFLATHRHFPRLHKAIIGYIVSAGVLLALTVVFDSQRYALLLAFVFVSLFSLIMLGMGIMSVRAGYKPARYFLLAAITSMLGTALTALTVWGFIPFHTWSFRAIDIGMLLDATLLALALSYQFRVGQEERQRAERLARLDPLTQLNNRRAFYDITAPVWNIALRHHGALSVILLDIDHFKQINDAHGHACGDHVLQVVARTLSHTVREQDIIARWGGEEFIVLLPETAIEAAAALAERLRNALATLRLQHEGKPLSLTASFGTAQREGHHLSLDMLISAADTGLYHAKDSGRNTVATPAHLTETHNNRAQSASG